MTSPCNLKTPLCGQGPHVRIVAKHDDPYHGLKGHAYIKARNLSPQVQRVQTSAQIPPPRNNEVAE